MSQFDDDMASLVEYMNTTKAKTTDASKLKDAFSQWYNNLGWYAKNVDATTTWNQARNYKKQFERANSTSAEELQNVLRVQQTGMTSEQMQGVAAVAQTSGGLYAAPNPDDKPLIPPEYKWAAVVVVAGGVLLFAYGLSASAPAAIAAWASRPKRVQS
jgi:hypothetical protein